jgi:class 3 adenylate cyclase
MSLKTENLAIVLTDIAGYTESTQSQSRLDNARLLATHNRILLPIIRRFKGRHVKSIGDALLLVFRSPTDAMLCAMAMQDALYEYNRNAARDQQIHIRVAASLGEVRVTRNDVFGEAVNITSRIEGVTPPDEIYLSEAVYMAMNKAEVPAQEAGWRELKGVSAPIRVFNIPRFATPRLVPQDVMAADDMSDLVYPYGGAHLVEQAAEEGVVARLARGVRESRAARLILLALVILPVAAVAVQAIKKQRAAQRETVALAGKPVPGPAPGGHQPGFALGNDASPAKPATVQPAPAATASAPQYQQEFNLPKPQTYTRISDAKRAYKDGRLGKDEYKKIVNQLENQMDREIDQAKRDYKGKKIDKKTYKDRIAAIEKKYK